MCASKIGYKLSLTSVYSGFIECENVFAPFRYKLSRTEFMCALTHIP